MVSSANTHPNNIVFNTHVNTKTNGNHTIKHPNTGNSINNVDTHVKNIRRANGDSNDTNTRINTYTINTQISTANNQNNGLSIRLIRLLKIS